ncbi:metal-dependent hydrolase [Paenibacillus mesotrionivorans]|uniref:Metal-dependent hydrolase n=1 Tax=Paenibacillus mesotrionivorans TaxID=3160968 RepID=A0ACC7NZB5_9BACL
MNKNGHIALGLFLGSAYLLWRLPQPEQHIVEAGVTLAAVGVGSLLPDIDHKTSTVSGWVAPFSPKTRKQFRHWGLLLLVLGAVICILYSTGVLRTIPDRFHLPLTPKQVQQTGLLLVGAGVLLSLLARLRELILLGVGAWLLYAYMVYELHWFIAVIGISAMIIPLVKHRGVIHTPEFALVLTIGAGSLVQGQPWYTVAITSGLIVGWWIHLVGDLPGSEGIQSLIIPRMKVALHLFSNGGRVERWVVNGCLVLTVLIWVVAIVYQPVNLLPGVDGIKYSLENLL